MAIYQARFLKYLQGRGLADTANRKVWAFLGDGECDEPESLGAISLGGREQLDNLVFVINCNLQRLDGPVRGNGKIIQELEGIFRGAGWNVIKVLWGSGWDELLAGGHHRHPAQADGGGASTASTRTSSRRTAPTSASTSSASIPSSRPWSPTGRDDQIWAPGPRRPRPVQGLRRLPRGPAPQGPADRHPRQDRQGLRHGRGRRGAEHHPSAEEDGRDAPARVPRPLRPAADRRADQGDPVPQVRGGQPGARRTCTRGARRWAATCRRGGRSRRRSRCRRCQAFAAQLVATEGREISTTMAFVRILNTLLRDKKIGKHVVPIVPDESRTFGMEGMFRQFGIFSQVGQLYRPAGCRPADVLQGGQGRPDPAGGDQRGRGHGLLDRRGDVLQHQRRADDPVLHLLLDVRLPARRRPRLGRRRHARPRLPRRRHLRADDAQRRGPAARGRPQPRLSRPRSPTASPTTRPSPTRWR